MTWCFRGVAVMSMLVPLVGCGPQGGTDVGNGATVKLQLQAYEDPALTGTQSITTSSGVRVDAAWVAVDRIRFVPSTDCEESETEIDVEGPFVADLVGAGVLGGPPRFPVTGDDFCELKVGFRELESGTEPAGTPPALVGLSMRVEGERADGTPFVVSSKMNDRLELEAKDGVPFTLPAGDNPLFIAFEIGSWINALALDGLGPGPLVIDANENSDRLAAFENAVEASIRLLRDADEDGELDLDEVEDGSELAK
ncbi:MAG TPA: hypothetical protein ENK57_02860 [Polyangiaceae bacterium]|nr:hypothetical protein [Polyangiaceae bacterium]